MMQQCVIYATTYPPTAQAACGKAPIFEKLPLRTIIDFLKQDVFHGQLLTSAFTVAYE